MVLNPLSLFCALETDMQRTKRDVIDLTHSDTDDGDDSIKGSKKLKRHADAISYTDENSSMFPRGKLFWTPVPDNHAINDTMTFENLVQMDILKNQSSTIEHILLTTMVVDWKWLFSILPNHIPWTVVADSQEDNIRSKSIGKQYRLSTKKDLTTRVNEWGSSGENVLLIHPPFYGTFYGHMHSKLMLIFYTNRLRLVVSTANLIPYDYGQIQNMFYVQDFFKKPADYTRSLGETVSLGKDLVKLLSAMNVPKDRICKIQDYDLRPFTHKLVLSIPGSYPFDFAFSSGILDLKNKLIDANICSEFSPSFVIESQSSSVGQLKHEFIKDFMEVTGIKSTKDSALLSHLKLVFPSKQMVFQSKSGPINFGTVFLSYKAYTHPEFPRSCLYHAEHVSSAEIGLHSKIISFWNQNLDSSPLWIYIGSHNFSSSAWGSWTVNRSKFIVKNYELGILFTSPDTCKSFKFPYRRPPIRYDSSDEPWMQDHQLDL